MNSKTEYDRCRIPRLVVQEEDEEEIAKKEEQEITDINRELEEESKEWGSRKFVERNQEARRKARNLGGINDKFGSKKRNTEGAEKGARTNRRKFDLLDEDWGYTVKEQESLLHNRRAPQSPTMEQKKIAPQPARSPITSSIGAAGATATTQGAKNWWEEEGAEIP